jgi:hypothetical protein
MTLPGYARDPSYEGLLGNNFILDKVKVRCALFRGAGRGTSAHRGSLATMRGLEDLGQGKGVIMLLMAEFLEHILDADTRWRVVMLMRRVLVLLAFIVCLCKILAFQLILLIG